MKSIKLIAVITIILGLAASSVSVSLACQNELKKEEALNKNSLPREVIENEKQNISFNKPAPPMRDRAP